MYKDFTSCSHDESSPSHCKGEWLRKHAETAEAPLKLSGGATFTHSICLADYMRLVIRLPVEPWLSVDPSPPPPSSPPLLLSICKWRQ